MHKLTTVAQAHSSAQAPSDAIELLHVVKPSEIYQSSPGQAVQRHYCSQNSSHEAVFCWGYVVHFVISKKLKAMNVS